LWLRNPTQATEAFALAWSEHDWPAGGAVRLSFSFAYDNVTGYGTTIGVGSEPYSGERTLSGDPPPYGIEDILSIHHNQSSFTARLLGSLVWTGTAGDLTWHDIVLERRETTFILWVDGDEIARGVSYWRPQSLYLGNPVIVLNDGHWSEVGIDNVQLEVCERTVDLPLILNGYVSVVATPTPTVTLSPTLVPTLPVEPTIPPVNKDPGRRTRE
jgi:hypothetical protein